MANNPKLEVYQVWLKPYKDEDKTFRDFFIETNSSENSEEDENSVIFQDFFKDLIKKIDTDDFINYTKKKKAFAAYDTKLIEGSTPTIKMGSTKNLIEGVIEGGRYGQSRNKASMKNKSEKEGIKEADIILDKFYFCLYTPMDSDLGILFLQCYSTDTISDIFTDFIRYHFNKQGVYRKAKVEKFVPRRLIEEFTDHSNIKKFTYTSRFVFDQLFSQSIGEIEEEFTIKIEATPKDGLPKESLGQWIDAIGKKMFGNRRLAEFNKGKVYLKNEQTKKETPFDISSDFEIKPVIYLEGRIDIGEDGIPNFEQLSDYCMKLLDEEVIPEMYPTHEVQER